MGLTVVGHEQACTLARRLAAEPIERIISSPHACAFQSARPLSEHTGLTIETDERLNERVLCTTGIPDWQERLAATFIDLDMCLPGGESSRMALTRAVAVINDVLHHRAVTTVVVTHGNLMALILKHFDASFGFTGWSALTYPDVYRVRHSLESTLVERVVWKGSRTAGPTGPPGSTDVMPPEAVAHYNAGREGERLSQGSCKLELARTQELLQRYLPPAPAVVLDVGGGTGVYALWLSRMGYQVHVIDAMPLHVGQARRAGETQPHHPLASAAVGDARHLEFPDEDADAVLLLGPLYHLTEREVAALAEARRVLRDGGVVCAVGISRFVSTFNGLFQGLFEDPEFSSIAERDRFDGQHRNVEGKDYFTTTFFHHPDELGAEIVDAGLVHEATLGVEGPGWLLTDFDQRWLDREQREQVLSIARWFETEPSLLGSNVQLMAVGRKVVPGS
jgi:broad specificity phosphatase PhoE/SAM-dependent methyltransferase